MSTRQWVAVDLSHYSTALRHIGALKDSFHIAEVFLFGCMEFLDSPARMVMWSSHTNDQKTELFPVKLVRSWELPVS